MNRKLILIIIISSFCFLSYGQEEYTNRFSMKLQKMSDGTFQLINRDKYAHIVNLDTISDLLVPYTHKDKQVSTSDYKKVASKEYVYKSYTEYDLKLIVDFAISETPAPFMVFIHGGGWARGDFNSNSDISKYCAQNAGITGVRISYTLADKPNANIMVTMQDVVDAVKWVQKNQKELNINPNVFGFMGSSAGAHLSAVAAMTIPGAKVLVGVSGIYDLLSASISINTTDIQRIKYFKNKDKQTLVKASPSYNIPDKNIPACYLIHGTADLVVECSQTLNFAYALRNKNIQTLKVDIFPLYDHNIGSKKSDLKEKLFFESFNFIKTYLQ
jgi:acetyl esterase/lipase